MATTPRTWRVQLDGQRHVVRYLPGLTDRPDTIDVDGYAADLRWHRLRDAARHAAYEGRFRIGDHAAVIRWIETNRRAPRDGWSIGLDLLFAVMKTYRGAERLGEVSLEVDGSPV